MIKWEPAVLTERGIVAITRDIPGADTMHWGDGTSSPITGAAMRKTYDAPADYAVIAKNGDTTLAQASVRIRDGLTPNVTFAAAADNPNIIEATINADPPGSVSEWELSWEPGAVDRFYAPKGTVKAHGYQAGTYTPLVRDLHTRRALQTEITVVDKEYDPDFSVAQGSDAQTALLTLTTVVTPGKPVLIDWGHDGEQSTIDDGQQDATTTHLYPTLAEPETYIVQVVYADGSTDGSARLVTIPFPAP